MVTLSSDNVPVGFWWNLKVVKRLVWGWFPAEQLCPLTVGYRQSVAGLHQFLYSSKTQSGMYKDRGGNENRAGRILKFLGYL